MHSLTEKVKSGFGNFLVLVLILFFPFQNNIRSQSERMNISASNTKFPEFDRPGGRYIPSKTQNSFFRILVIFAQFPDDEWNIAWPEWPKGHAPAYINDFIDSTVSEHSNTGNITQYFRAMSLGAFTVIGNCYSVIAPRTRRWYSDNKKDRADINKDVIEKLNRIVSFKPFDNWHLVKDYTQINRPDSLIDMICVIWRSINNEGLKLNFTNDFRFTGEASLGSDMRNVTFKVDNGVRSVAEGFPGFGVPGSGLTIAAGYNGHNLVQQYTIHELGHYLFGDNRYHIQTGVWGIMAGYGSRSQVANSYERNRLGWISFIQYDKNPSGPIPLGDYVTTGQALRIAIPGTGHQKYYLIENHQMISRFDNFDRTSGGKGIYVLYQAGKYNIDLQFYNAEGRADWQFDHYTIHPTVGVKVPVFRKGQQDPVSGLFDTQSINYIDPDTKQLKSAPIEAYIENGKDYFEPLFKGDGRNEMKPGYVDVLSPWSNPPLQNVSIRIISGKYNLEVMQYADPGTLIDVPPSKPQNLTASYEGTDRIVLHWSANTEPDLAYYKIYRETGDTEGQNKFSFITNVPGERTYWKDREIMHGSGREKIFYKITAVDSTNKESVKSDYAEALKKN